MSQGAQISPRKRDIPVNKKGVKDDWQAMRAHLETINSTAQKQEKELLANVRQEYNKELANEVHQKREKAVVNRQREKSQDAEQVREKVMDHQRSVAMHKDRQLKMKADLSTSYDRALDYKTSKKHHEFKANRDQEKVRLEQVQRSLQAEEEYRKARLTDQIAEEKAVYKEKQIRKMQERLNAEKEKVVEAQNAVEDQKRYLDQQRSYVQFYQNKEHKQQRLMSNYSKSVLAEEREKKMKMSQWKENQDKMHQDQQKARLAQEQTRKSLELQRVNDTLAVQMDLKTRAKASAKQNYFEGITERRQKETKDEAFNQMMLKDRADKQKMYKAILDQQKEISSKLRSEELRMSHSERKVNRKDLQSFKYAGSESGHSMIPGFGFSNHLKTLRASGSQPSLRHHSSSGFESPKGVINSKGFNQSSSSFSPVNPAKTEAKKRERVKEMSVASSSLNKTVFPNRNTDNFDTSYNPITNPIPNYNQNPYLSKQGQSMIGMSKGGFFARQASNSILS
mmetsp:Transcript_22640/g.25489  ORF Transcript_22640/g.25489 Transcript_22640/m.25489 type:complete len:509 (-) Transcript_22640:532-2058(-)